MQQIRQVIRQMIQISEQDLDILLRDCYLKTFKKQEVMTKLSTIPNEIFFINKGILRVLITDNEGVEHTIHFALENQFIADYASFIVKEPSIQMLQAIEEVEAVVIPRSAVEWGYQNISQGDRLGRLIAEYYFIYQDNRIKNTYIRTPKERYETITEIFPNIHNRVPQHQIASYLGITSVHLSRLKKLDLKKT